MEYSILITGVGAFDMNKYIKMLIFNLCIAFLNIIVFSPGLVGLKIGSSSILSTALGMTLIIMSVVVFFYGNYSLLSTKAFSLAIEEIDTPEEYVSALKNEKDKYTFANTIDILIGQIERMQKKKETVLEILNQKYSKADISFQRINSALNEVEYVFYLNLKGIINRLKSFDEEEYQRITHNLAGQFSQSIINNKMQLLKEYVQYINKNAEYNEEIILKLEKLLFEISKLDGVDAVELDNMPEIQEINRLINNQRSQ